MDVNLERTLTYAKEHSWQYDIRQGNFEQDMAQAGLRREEVVGLTTDDFTFVVVEDKQEHRRMTEFIERHEWMGTVPTYTTHWFAAYYKDILAGVILMGQPNAFSKLLGNHTRRLERLVSRAPASPGHPKTWPAAC